MSSLCSLFILNTLSSVTSSVIQLSCNEVLFYEHNSRSQTRISNTYILLQVLSHDDVQSDAADGDPRGVRSACGGEGLLLRTRRQAHWRHGVPAVEPDGAQREAHLDVHAAGAARTAARPQQRQQQRRLALALRLARPRGSRARLEPSGQLRPAAAADERERHRVGRRRAAGGEAYAHAADGDARVRRPAARRAGARAAVSYTQPRRAAAGRYCRRSNSYRREWECTSGANWATASTSTRSAGTFSECSRSDRTTR